MEIASELSSTQQKILDAADQGLFRKRALKELQPARLPKRQALQREPFFVILAPKRGSSRVFCSVLSQSFQKSQVIDFLAEVFRKRRCLFLIVSIIKKQLNAIQQQLPLLKMLFYEAQFHTEIQEIIVDKIVKPILDLLGQSV
jgi:hypothetical protein